MASLIVIHSVLFNGGVKPISKMFCVRAGASGTGHHPGRDAPGGHRQGLQSGLLSRPRFKPNDFDLLKDREKYCCNPIDRVYVMRIYTYYVRRK